jgi:hypothetical protein
MAVSTSSLVIILLGGSALFAVACVLDFIVGGVLGFVFVESFIGPGFGVPFRFFQLDLFGRSGDYLSILRVILDWLIWCLVFAALFHGVRVLVRG